MTKTETEKTSKGKSAAKSSSQKQNQKQKKTASRARTEVTSETTAAQTLSAEERYRMIQDAAYHVAEKDGFQRGREQDYWLQAEKEIDGTLQRRNASETQDVH